MGTNAGGWRAGASRLHNGRQDNQWTYLAAGLVGIMFLMWIFLSDGAEQQRAEREKRALEKLRERRHSTQAPDHAAVLADLQAKRSAALKKRPNAANAREEAASSDDDASAQEADTLRLERSAQNVAAALDRLVHGDDRAGVRDPDDDIPVRGREKVLEIQREAVRSDALQAEDDMPHIRGRPHNDPALSGNK